LDIEAAVTSTLLIPDFVIFLVVVFLASFVLWFVEWGEWDKAFDS